MKTKNQKSVSEKLGKIIQDFENKEYNENVYNVGGGIAENSFVSRRHENAKNDEGKLTQGEAVALFKKATEKTSDEINRIIDIVYDGRLEYHHAGYYNGNMRKVFFLNSNQIVYLAKNWEHIYNTYKRIEELENEIKHIKHYESRVALNGYINKHGVSFERISETEIEKYPYRIVRYEEMHGKYGYFPATYQYNLPVYYSGIYFENKTILDGYYNLWDSYNDKINEIYREIYQLTNQIMFN